MRNRIIKTKTKSINIFETSEENLEFFAIDIAKDIIRHLGWKTKRHYSNYSIRELDKNFNGELKHAICRAFFIVSPKNTVKGQQYLTTIIKPENNEKDN